MIIRNLILIFCLLASFNLKSQANKVEIKEFTDILDSLDVKGSILIFDFQKNIYYSNDFNRTNQGFIPASTFKIPNSIIGLELEILKDENSVFKWNGEKRNRPEWEKDLTLKEAFQVSCVPCYQELAGKIGIKRMKKYLKKLGYKNMFFDETTLNNFWLTGQSNISQTEQIDFLRKFYFSELPITEKTQRIVKNIMEFENTPEYILSGKTGWGVIEDINIGWYVGYLEKNDRVYFFALNINSTESTRIENFGEIRINATKEALKTLKLIK